MGSTPLACLYATSGPQSGPIRHFDTPRHLEVVARIGSGEVMGRAQLAGWLFDESGPVATYRLLIDGIELETVFTCVARRFEPVMASG